MSVVVVSVNGKPNNPDQKTFMLDEASEINTLSTDCAPGSFAALTDFSKIWRLSAGKEWKPIVTGGD